jgi:Calx-beta domain-containing protein/SprB-like repeat protein/List-Bact-rpt repeat protein
VRTRQSNLALATIALLFLPASLRPSPVAAADSEREREAQVQSVLPVGGATALASPVSLVRAATVNFTDLARREGMGFVPRPPVRTLIGNELEFEPAEPAAPTGAATLAAPAPFVPFVASPSPGNSFKGLDDIPMVDSSYIVIPPDVGGAVGPTRTFEGHNNNYRVLNKSDGSVIATVGTATFWNSVITNKALLNQLTDPRTVYDPVQGRWIVAMQTVNANGLVLIGVSQTSDPAGSWFLYAFGSLSASYLIDFPTLGFNKNWIAVAINRYSSAGAFQRGVTVVASYPQARAGTLGSATIFTQAAGTHFCSAPCVTHSASEDTLFVVTHLSSSGGTYAVDVITGSATPAYVAGGTLTRPGGGWVQPSGNLLPQSAPLAGASACGATPCPIESQDSQIRSAPVYRNGFIYYAQTIGLPSSGLMHTAAQWTKITPSVTAAFVDGGRIEDATATSSNGGKWYAFPSIAVNSADDFIVGYTQYSSAQHPAAGYSYHDHTDGAGTIRDPLIYKAGEDYYHKDFGGGRNRWGDFSQAAVDPSDDRSLWALQEYAKVRVSGDDGATGSNGSRWSTYWAVVAGPQPTVALAPGPSVSEGSSGPTALNFTVNLSTAYSLPVTVNFQTADGSATVANNDYQAASGSIVIPAGLTSGTITVNAIGDTQSEPDETFTLSLTGATNGTLGAPIVATGTILNDDLATFVITASAGAGGSISPSGSVNVTQGQAQGFTISPASCHHVSDVLVDGSSVGAVTSFNFSNVQANHSIAASFALDGPFKISASAGPGGTVTPSGSIAVACGDTQTVLITPANSCEVIADVVVDGSSVGAVSSFAFNGVHANHTISATFAGSNLALSSTQVNASCTGASDGSINLTVSGGVPGFGYSWSNGATSEDISALAAGIYTVTVTDSRGCQASLSDTIAVPAFTIVATAGANGSIAPAGNVSVPCGTNKTFTLTPDSGFQIDQLTVDGGSVTPAPSFTFTGVTAGHTINVTFKPAALAVEAAPLEFALGRVIPNPMFGSMHVQYGIPTESTVRLSILDIQGREVALLASGRQPAGWYSTGWSGVAARGRAPAGLYFLRLQAGSRAFVQRFVLTR